MRKFLNIDFDFGMDTLTMLMVKNVPTQTQPQAPYGILMERMGKVEKGTFHEKSMGTSVGSLSLNMGSIDF